MKTGFQNQAAKIILALVFGFTVPAVYAYSFADACPINAIQQQKTVYDKTGKIVTCYYDDNEGHLTAASQYNDILKCDITYVLFSGSRKIHIRRADFNNLVGYQKTYFTFDGELSSIESNIGGLKMHCYRSNYNANPNQFSCNYNDYAVGVQFKLNAYINDIILSD